MGFFEKAPSAETGEKRETLKRKINTIIKALLIAGAVILPTKAEDSDEMPQIKADDVELKLKTINPEYFQEGYEFVQEMIQKEMEDQGYNSEEIEKTLRADVQGENTPLPTFKEKM